MSLDPVFTAEFADAELLAEIPADGQAALSDGVLQGAIDGATWDGQLVVAPLWANTQVLWYRKSVAEAAGLDMTQPVTWDQIIDAASDNGGYVGVQANKYEGYVVWINALIEGAGGDIVTDTEAGADASVDIGSEAGTEAARHHPEAGRLAGRDARPVGVQRGHGARAVRRRPRRASRSTGRSSTTTTPRRGDRSTTSAGRATRRRSRARSRGRRSAASTSASARSPTSPSSPSKPCSASRREENQVQYAVETANMPARAAAYDDAGLQEQFPADLLELYRTSIDSAGPRPASPYWATIVNATLNKWHPADSVNPDSTPESSASFIEQVLHGEALL